MNKKSLFRIIFVLSLIINIVSIGYIGIDYVKNKRNRNIFKLNAYAWANNQIKSPESGENRVVFIGNSITENWVHLRYKFFKDNNYICRGIGGQTSPLLLLRFRQDAIDLHPKVVVINAGINDIAENTGEYDPIFTLDNIKSMAQLADKNGIKVILTSVLPSNGYGWKSHIKNITKKIKDLNAEIKTYANDNGYTYVDYYSVMVNSEDKGMKEGYSFDGLHPDEEGYSVMEPIITKAINDVLNQN
ncbi:capsular biosynthesis protein [Dysgonomonas sp. Marseille-P4677]|uniref:GDSL-type esterase/lipase family protein n=1 Tax=Dysgonomonas sp. Marseille-P4677 TaxID=2364790 RepID=UPI0019137B67|nr:GDSL-type esterase/lipase family protein [Dysgonomonas sp. Marseille-P4677]MBK5722941.1 capsular biosynthesis protein [Dysgonomonas sp. Marseille-P4677]